MFSVNTLRYSMETDGNMKEITNTSGTTNSIHGFFLSLAVSFHFISLAVFLLSQQGSSSNRQGSTPASQNDL